MTFDAAALVNVRVNEPLDVPSPDFSIVTPSPPPRVSVIESMTNGSSQPTVWVVVTAEPSNTMESASTTAVNNVTKKAVAAKALLQNDFIIVYYALEFHCRSERLHQAFEIDFLPEHER